jgi:hypothetical protein
VVIGQRLANPETRGTGPFAWVEVDVMGFSFGSMPYGLLLSILSESSSRSTRSTGVVWGGFLAGLEAHLAIRVDVG